MKKILIVSTVSRQFYLFEQGNIKVLKSLGYEVHGAANFEDSNVRLDKLEIVRHHFDIQRSPFSFKNIKAYKQLKKIMSTEKFDAVHCHSPMGGFLARLAAKSIGIKTVIYTAHGFHFFKGAPLINWMVYYQVERWLAKYTDILITINKEDYQRAEKSFKAGRVEYIPGVGIDTKKISEVIINKSEKRREVGISDNDFVILSVGELNKNKNHETVIRALGKLNNSKIHYLICGQGLLETYLKSLVTKLGLENQVHLLGFRKDVIEICKASDIFIFPSKREGLGLSALEAMACGLPIITSNIHGIVDYSVDEVTGYSLNPKDAEGFAKAIVNLTKDERLRARMGRYNLEAVKIYDWKNVEVLIEEIYKGL